MENFYTAYTRSVNGVTFTFVKHYQQFPEYRNLPPLLRHYGMHTDFYKACKIAMVNDPDIQLDLLREAERSTGKQLIVQPDRSETYTYKLRHGHFRLSNLVFRNMFRRLLHFRDKSSYHIIRS